MPAGCHSFAGGAWRLSGVARRLACCATPAVAVEDRAWAEAAVVVGGLSTRSARREEDLLGGVRGEAARERNRQVVSQALLPEPGTTNEAFAAHKARVLERTLLNDKSPKGSVDVRNVDILQEINRRPEFVTTSSCSGRVLFMAYPSAGGSEPGAPVLPGVKTHRRGHLRASHDGIFDVDAYFALEEIRTGDDLWLLVRPFTLDVACASAEDARRLVMVAQQTFKRGASIISPAREWRTVVGIEGNQNLEMPFIISGQKVYSGSLRALADIVNAKLHKNWEWMDRFLEDLRRDL